MSRAEGRLAVGCLTRLQTPQPSTSKEITMTNQQTALLTGAARGLGNCTARYLAERGWRIFATDIDAEGLAALQGFEGISTLLLDVQDQASISAAFEEAEAQTGGLDGLVNFAGTIAMGSMVEIDEATFFEVMDTNLMGTFRVNRTFFPLILQRKGRIVNISSEVGWQRGAPFAGAYSISKHAIEAYTDSLRRELAFLGVAVIKIQPGPFRTRMTTDLAEMFGRASEASTHFKHALARTAALVPREAARARDPVVVAEVVHKALTADRPRASYSVKPDPQRVFLEWLPGRWADALVKRMLSG
jgi:NAD(P)-dependent dehydrogenase (short-subunit alcohol dehydrogenase family)